jgi:DNA-directed RNA polymerase subunit F
LSRVHRGFAASPIVWLVVGLVGCGGEGETTAAPVEPPALTREEFLAEADRICFATESQIEAAVDDYAVSGEEPDPAQVRRVVGQIVVPSLRSEARAIRLLDPPPADEDEVEAILAATSRGADELAADPLSAIDGPPAALLEAERLARRYGSQECGLRGLSR